MQKTLLFRPVLALVLACGVFAARAGAILGDAPQAPNDLSDLPGRGPHPNLVGTSLSVNTSSREQVREFYNAVYTSSTGVPMYSTAETGSCYPGTNSTAFASATLLRINWYRAMAGIPAAITFDSTESTKDQAAATMMSAQNQLQHVGSWVGWTCFSSNGTNASASSNLALGYDGPDAIDGYILDNGGGNYEVGHRRWILYPQTQIMATGDVPQEGTNYAANATWVFDANYGGPRPATRTPYVTWPPAGYVPYQVVYPQWSFALSNANFGTAKVTMSSNGVALPVKQQTYTTGYGENTLVWYLSTQNPANDTAFPFNGTDIVYSVTISNVVTSSGTKSYSYTVTVFDPATPGADYSPLVVNGPTQPTVNTSSQYTCTPASNPNTTGYQWVASQTTNGYLMDTAQNGLTNFTVSPTPDYSVVTTPPVGSGNCFNLCHESPNPVPQYLQLNRVLYPSNSATFTFSSLIGYATSDEVAHVQASTDGGATWQDLFVEAGSNGSGESSFTQHTLSLTNYAGKSTLLRFDYDFSYGGYYSGGGDSTVGWDLENITVSNCLQLVSQVTNSTTSTNLMFTPAQVGSYLIQSRGVIFTSYPIDFGAGKSLSAVTGQTVLTVSSLAASGRQIKINFGLASGTASSFHLLQANQLGGTWATNNSATLTTNVPGSSYQFTVTNNAVMRFYRVMTP